MLLYFESWSVQPLPVKPRTSYGGVDSAAVAVELSLPASVPPAAQRSSAASRAARRTFEATAPRRRGLEPASRARGERPRATPATPPARGRGTSIDPVARDLALAAPSLSTRSSPSVGDARAAVRGRRSTLSVAPCGLRSRRVERRGRRSVEGRARVAARSRLGTHRERQASLLSSETERRRPRAQLQKCPVGVPTHCR